MTLQVKKVKGRIAHIHAKENMVHCAMLTFGKHVRYNAHMRIIHIIGARCSGKTTLSKAVNLNTWDVFEFYKRHRCIDENQMPIWSAIDRARIKLLPDLNHFINRQKLTGRSCVVESSGINLSIENYLSTCGVTVSTVCVEAPDAAELERRCKMMKVSYAAVAKYNDTWQGKALMMGKGPMLSIGDALKRIRSLK